MRLLNERLGMQLCGVHLVDASYLMDANKYLAGCALSMTAKISFESCPLINVVSKCDLLGQLGRPQMNLIDLENLSGLHYLFWGMGEDEDDSKFGAFNKKYAKLTNGLCELIENYAGMSGFLLLDIHTKEMLAHLIGQVDKSNGYFNQPEKVKNEREAAIDYNAIELFVSTEAVQMLYDKYVDPCEEV